MRIRTEDLLKIRDGKPVDAVLLAEVTGDPEAEVEIRRLRDVQTQLKSLPDFAPPADTWSAIAERSREPVASDSSSAVSGQVLKWALAAAAAIVAIVLVLPQDVEVDPPELAVVASGQTNADTSPLVRPQLASLVAQSRRLEQMLGELPARPRLVNAATVGAIGEMEDRILVIDYQLSAASAQGLSDEAIGRLWQERVALMDSLVGLRYAQAQRLAF